MASEQMGMPAAAPSAEEMAVFDQMRQNISPKEFSDEMLAGASQVDPQAVAEFKQELDGLDMPPEVLDALNDLVDEILASPERYDEIRQQYIEQGIPDDFLPEQFDPQFFAALNMAIDQMIGAPAGPQAFAKGGIAELKPIAKAIASYGRNGDTMLAHITPAEARMLKRRGGSGTINPKTGLPEFFIKKIFKSVGKALKKVGNAVKKFASSTVGRVITTVALGFFLGPAAASMLGVSSAAGVAAVSGFVGSAGSTLMAGGNLRDALKAGAVGGITAGVGAGIMGGSEAFTAGSYTGPTTVGGQFERFKSAISPTSLQQAAAPVDATALEGSLAKAPVPGAEMAPGQVPGTAPVPDVGAPMGPDNIDVGGGWSPAGQPPAGQPSMPTDSGIAPPVDVTGAEGSLAKLPGTVGPEGITERFKGYWDKISPSEIQKAGAIKAEQAGIKAMEAMQARLPNATPAMLENAYQTAYKATMPGVIGTYGPMAAVGIGALGAMGGFETKPAELTPEARMMRDRLERESQMMRDNPGMFSPKGMERFGAVYDDKGQIIKWNPWTPESAGAFAQYRSPTRFPMFAPPPPPRPGFAQGGLASLAGGGVPGYANGGGVTKEIQDWYAANEGKGTQADLDRFLASGYTAEQINAALPQWGVKDLQNAIEGARSRVAASEPSYSPAPSARTASDPAIQQIQQWWAANEGKGTQADLDRWLATSGYSAAQMNAALPQFSVTDLNNAIREAKAKQEAADNIARRAAYLRERGVNLAGTVYENAPPVSSYTPSAQSAVPQAEIEAARQRIRAQDPELAEFLEWRLGEFDPMFHQRIGDMAAQYNQNPYAWNENMLAQWKETIEGAKRRAEMGGNTPEWMQPGWRERQAARNAAYDAEQARQRELARYSATVVGPSGSSGFVTGPGGGGGGTGGGGGGGGGGGTPTPPPGPGTPPPPPPPPPPIPPPQTPTPPDQIPWNTMPDFQRYVQATAGSPIRPTYSVLGNTVQGPQDPFGAGKQTPIYSQMGAPTSPMAQSASMLENSSINLPQYMFDPLVSPAQLTFDTSKWYGPVSEAVQPKGAVHTSNPNPNDPRFSASSTPPGYMNGGIAALASGGYPRRTGQIDGPGTETSDSIPAMLSDGEFVMTAKAVRGAGNGSRREGAKKMYALMHRLEKNAARG